MFKSPETFRPNGLGVKTCQTRTHQTFSHLLPQIIISADISQNFA